MEAPYLIKLLGSDISIELTNPVIVDNEPAMGTYDQEQSKILIKDGMSSSSLRDTLVHEILHAILQHYEMDSEKIVRVITPAIVSVLRDNPALVDFITAGTGYPSRPGYEQLHQTEHSKPSSS